MQALNTEQYFFTDDGTTPNSLLPVVIYRQVCDAANKSQWLEDCFRANGWTNNWRDIVLRYHHFHSTTHEVLGVGRGTVKLQIGGVNGKVLQAAAGDVLIIPAGVGHCSVNNDDDYKMVGGYPGGASWDLLTGTPEERATALPKIKALPIPSTDPVFGINGTLQTLWQQISK